MQRTTTIDYYGKPAKLTADATLHAIGEQRPYFSLTGEVQIPRRRDCEECGCIHERILATWPDLADVAALHLSDIDGVPMSAEADGWYWLAGYLGVARTFTGRTNRHGEPLPDSTEYTSATAEYLTDTPLAIFARHIRTTEDEASRLASRIVRATVRGLDDPDALYEAWARECESMRPRWKAEADAAIAHHGLTVTR
jgi:hypothetical protein